MITFPEEPYNGQEIVDRQPDDSVVIWMYEELNNQWSHRRYGKPDEVRVIPDEQHQGKVDAAIDALQGRIKALEEKR